MTTDIEFVQIREGQTIQIGGAFGANATAQALVDRVELLSERKVGQLAEVKFYEGADEPPGMTVAYWSGACWESIDGFGQQLPDQIIGEPRLLKPVPADAVVLPHEAIEEPRDLRSNAKHLDNCPDHIHVNAALTLRRVADAIEAARS